MPRQHLVAITVATLLTSPYSTHQAVSQQTDKTPLITVTGIGEVRVKPDLARLSFAITGQATTLTEAQSYHDKLLAAVKEKLAAKVANSGTITTATFDIRSVQSDFSGRASAPAAVGYRVNSQVEVAVELTKMVVDKLAELASTAVDAGATLVPSLGDSPSYREGAYGRYAPAFAAFELKDASKHKLAALRLAVADAGPKAAEVAKALGAKLGKIQSVTVGTERVYPSRSQQQETAPGTSPLWAEMVVQTSVTINYVIEF